VVSFYNPTSGFPLFIFFIFFYFDSKVTPLPTSSATCHMCSFARLVLEDVLLLFSCVDLCYRVHILTRHNFCFSFDAGCLAFQCKTEKPTRRSASAAVSKETQCKCCRFLFFVLGSLLPLSSCWALSIHKVREAEITQNPIQSA